MPETPKTILSDSSIRLYYGDCLQLLNDIPDHSVDMILCDLPYGQTHNLWDRRLPLTEPWGLWRMYERVAKENAAIVLFGSGMFTAELMMSNPKMWRYNLIWQKTLPVGFLNANRMPLRAHEDICVFYKKLPVYHPQKTQGHGRKTSVRKDAEEKTYGAHKSCSYDSTERFPTSILTFAQDKQKEALHPTQKPVALCEWLIKTYTDEGAVVLDNCMGSGTTGVACVNTNRKFIGMEADREYFQKAKERIQKQEEKNK